LLGNPENSGPASESTLVQPVAPPACLGYALAGQFGAFLLSIPAFLLFMDPKTKELRQSPAATAAMFVPLWIAFAVTVYVVARRRNEHPLGRRPTFHAKDTGWLVAGVAAQFGVGIVYSLLPIDTTELGKPAHEILDRANENSLGVVLLGLAVGIGAPVMEELFYRGVVHRGLVLRFANASGFVKNVVPFLLSSAIFAAIHFQALQFGALFAVGALCAFAFHKTGRIMSAIAVHAGFNLTTVVALSIAIFSKK
jgi:membrane protease YdiL (CAAX protease family)